MSTANGKRNWLNRQQERKVEDYIHDRFGEITSQKLNKAQTAVYLTEKLGFTVTEHNVNSAADAMGLKWPKFAGSNTGGGGKNGGFKQAQVLKDVCLTMIRIEAIIKEAADSSFTLPQSIREFASQ